MTIEEAISAWPVLTAHTGTDGQPCFWAGARSETGQCPDKCDLTPRAGTPEKSARPRKMPHA